MEAREAKSDSKAAMERQLKLTYEKKRMCKKCRERPVYLDIKGMDWCEECMWKFVKE
jgi:hypothetical protein